MATAIARAGGALILASALALVGCGGGGGGGGTGTPTPTPVPTPTPTPTPTGTATIVSLANQPPAPLYLAMLMTDGTVLAQANPDPAHGNSAGDFYILTPDITGSYRNGTLRKAASPPTGYAPFAGNEAVLPDGRVLFVGGEYNQDKYNSERFDPVGLTNMSAVYDPNADSWTMIPAPAALDYIGDVPGAMLPSGNYVFGEKLTNRMWSFDVAAMRWTQVAGSGYPEADFAEVGFNLMPDGSVFTASIRAAPKAYHFVPATGTWVADPNAPVNLARHSAASVDYGPAPAQTVGGVTYGPATGGTYFPAGEIGPAMLRPDGSLWVVGASVAGAIPHTAIYRSGASASQPGSWSVGPDFPAGEDTGDVPAVLMPGGRVLVAPQSGALYEFDGTTLVRTRPGGGGGAFILPLPSGEVLLLTPGEGTLARLYTSTGTPQNAWRPTIAAAPATLNRGQTHTLTGTQFNGLSEGAKVGDELDAATNYPLVRLTNIATGHVFYARTHGFTMGVATGSRVVGTSFDVPAGMETGTARLAVIASGIASAEMTITVT